MQEERRAARVLLVDNEHRVLLLQGGDPDEPDRGQWWITPGGGIEPGESPPQAAARELDEETGLRVPASELGHVVHERVTEFRFAGRDYRQSEDYFLLRVPAHEVDPDRPGAVADPGITGHRWWTLPALERTSEVVFPRDLRDVLGRVLGAAPC
ncbi:MAG: MutT/nudix-family hydrolase [Frankiales bacterium]|nr:MutT/nudix-family hydrolase [Frankiales bacterium]